MLVTEEAVDLTEPSQDCAVDPFSSSCLGDPVLQVYPKGEKDAVTIRESDKQRLLISREFLNDVIIEFYLKYIQPIEKNQLSLGLS